MNIIALPRSIIITFLLINFILTYLFLVLFFKLKSIKHQNVIIIGNNKETLEISNQLNHFKGFRVKFLGVITEKTGLIKNSEKEFKILGYYNNFLNIILNEKPDILIISIDNIIKKQKIIDLLDNKIFKKIKVFTYPSICEIMIVSPSYFRINDIPLIRLKKGINKSLILKRLIDFTGAIILIIFLSPNAICLSISQNNI